MDIKKFMKQDGEKPLDNIVTGGGMCGIFRKIACIGDSLSSGEFESFANGANGYHDCYDYSWGQYMARDAGCTVYNMSKGGMSAKEYENFAKEKGFYDDTYKSQAYIIALGVNDMTQVWNKEIEFGSIDDIDLEDYNKNKSTFAGYYARIVAKYQEIQPKAKFFLMTMPTSDRDPEGEKLYDKHAEFLHQIAAMFKNCYVIDMRKYMPKHDAEFKKNFYLGGHLNAAGYRLTALVVESYIDYIIRHNTEEFKQIGFVGTPYHNANEKW